MPKSKRGRERQLSLLYRKGVIYYCAGGARGFDTIAAEMVLELKKDYTQIKLVLILPCRDQTKGWLEEDVRKYNAIMEKADKVVYVAEQYFRGCMQIRNRHLVDSSSFCICYLKKNTGGTAFTVDYAKMELVKIYNIANKQY